MANAAEGKSTDTKPDITLCDVCEDETATKYCLVCPGPMCDNCIRSHKKTKLTKDHAICDIILSRLGSTFVRSTEAPAGLIKCQKHPDNEQEYFCDDCMCFLCTECKDNHNGHKIQLAGDDISVYRTVYHDHMKKMLDGVHDLEQYKSMLQKMIKEYEDACTEVHEKSDDLVQTIKQNATRLAGELRTVQRELKQQLGDAESGLIKVIDLADLGVSKLRDVRKVEDCEVLSHALEASQNDLNRLKRYKMTHRVSAVLTSTKKILPYTKEIDSFKDYVRVYFAMELPFMNVLQNCTNLIEESKMDISNPLGEQGYRFCKSRMERSLVIHAKNAADIRLLDYKNVEKQQIKPEVDIWNMVTVYHNEHVVIPSGTTKEISLLDENFKVVFTQQIEEGDIRALCCYAPHQFVMCTFTNTVMKFSIILVKGTSFKKQKEIEIEGIEDSSYMEMYPDKNHVCVACYRHSMLYKVNLSTSEFTIYDVSKLVEASVWSLCIDDNGITFVGDKNGNVHKFDGEMSHEIIAKIDIAARDVFVKDGCLLVSSQDNKLYQFG